MGTMSVGSSITHSPCLCDDGGLTRVVSGGHGISFWSGGIEKGMSQGDGFTVLSDSASGDGLSGGAVCPGTSETMRCQGEGLGDGTAIGSSTSDNGTCESGNVNSGNGPGSGDGGTIVGDSFNGTGD